MAIDTIPYGGSDRHLRLLCRRALRPEPRIIESIRCSRNSQLLDFRYRLRRDVKRGFSGSRSPDQTRSGKFASPPDPLA